MLQPSERCSVVLVKEDAGGNRSTEAFIMGPDVPLLNDYKQEFFWKRFPQTILGGPRLKLGYCAPPYVYIHQLVLFFTPWLLGGVGTLLYELGVMDDVSAGIVSGVLMLVVGTMLQTLSQWVARRTGAVQRLTVGHNVMADEEEVEFTRCAGPETVRFVAPGKRFMGNVVLHTALAGAMCGFGTWYLLPHRLTAVFGSIGAAIPLFVLSWITLCIGEYSLIVNTAAETATFQPQDTYEITALTRPLYIFAFIAVDLALRCVGGGMPELQVASQVMHMLFLALPVLWALGLLPPLDALILWLMEQSLIHVLGGSAMATNRRLVVMFLSSTCVSISAFFIPSSLGLVLFTVSMGFVLSQDLTQIPVLFWGRKQDSHTYTHSGPLSLGWWSLPLSTLLLTAAMSEAALLHSLRPVVGQNLSSWESWRSTDVVSDPQTLVGWVLVALFVITRVLREIQGACVLGGLFINPLYPKRVSSVQAFRRRSRGLWVAALIRRALINLVCPLAMIAFLSMDRALQNLNTAALAVGVTRAFRVVWQRSEDALLQMVVVIMVRLVDGGGMAQKWHDLGIGVQLILVSLVSDRLSQFLLKLKFALTVLVTSWTETKQRRQSAGALLALNMALCPLLVGVVMLAALLSAPLLPLFTLPVFLVGFPRPLRSWPGTPGTACPCPDSIYYQQLSTRLASALRHALASGALGSCSPGSHFLGRFQDRVVWISILEKGYGYCTVNIKGLELQETSCHTVEARRVDEVFEAAFDRLEHPGRFLRFLNTHWGNTLTPCALLPVIIYSDARNVLTGIIDSPDHLRQLRSDFLKALVWILLRHSMQNRTYRVKSHSLRSSQHAVQPEPGSNDAKLGVVSQSHFDSSSSPQLRGRSSLSSFSDWSDEDDLFGPVSVRKPVRRMIMRTEEEHASLPGSVEIHSLYENMALASLPTLRPLGLGIGLDKEKDEALPISSAPFDNFDSANPPNFSSPHSESLSLPTSWFSGPFCNSKLRPLRSSFPSEWFRFCLAQLVIEGLWEGEEEQSVCRALQEDRALMEMYSQVALSCALALGLDLAVPSASFVFRVYCGDSAWHEGLDWLRENNELNQLTLRAFRYSVKLLIDQASLGPVESLEELYSTLQDYHQHWFIGVTSERGWHDGVLQEKPFLFSLGHDLTMGSYTGRVLSLQECVFQLGALCEECVRGQWANLSWELLYATNDDEERYSIQAHTLLLRNLTVQAAEPPLGYPIYSCSPTHLACV